MKRSQFSISPYFVIQKITGNQQEASLSALQPLPLAVLPKAECQSNHAASSQGETWAGGASAQGAPCVTVPDWGGAPPAILIMAQMKGTGRTF